MKKIQHHPTCRANYPEKPAWELPQQETRIPLPEIGQVARVCVDCGASVLEPLP